MESVSCPKCGERYDLTERKNCPKCGIRAVMGYSHTSKPGSKKKASSSADSTVAEEKKEIRLPAMDALSSSTPTRESAKAEEKKLENSNSEQKTENSKATAPAKEPEPTPVVPSWSLHSTQSSENEQNEEPDYTGGEPDFEEPQIETPTGAEQNERNEDTEASAKEPASATEQKISISRVNEPADPFEGKRVIRETVKPKPKQRRHTDVETLADLDSEEEVEELDELDIMCLNQSRDEEEEGEEQPPFETEKPEKQKKQKTKEPKAETVKKSSDFDASWLRKMLAIPEPMKLEAKQGVSDFNADGFYDDREAADNYNTKSVQIIEVLKVIAWVLAGLLMIYLMLYKAA